jgi:hypothetical protein
MAVPPLMDGGGACTENDAGASFTPTVIGELVVEPCVLLACTVKV